MIAQNEKISIRQLQILLMLDIFGTGVIILPRRVSEMANQDGWMVIIGAMILAVVYAYLIGTLLMRYPGQSFWEYTSHLVSKPIAILLSLGLLVRFMVTTALELKVLGEIVHQTLLIKTPTWLVILLMLFTAVYAAWQGIECRARLAEILIFVAFVPLTLVLVICAFQTDFTNLLPFFTSDGQALALGSFHVSMIFQSLEFLLLASPFIRTPGKIRKGATSSVFVTGILLLLVTVLTLAHFGDVESKRKLFPVLQMMSTIDLPGAFIERQDVLIISFWIISVFAFVNAGIYFSSYISGHLINKKQSKLVWAVAAVVFAITLYPIHIVNLFEVIQWLNLYFGTFYIALLPVVLLAVSYLRDGRRNSHD